MIAGSSLTLEMTGVEEPVALKREPGANEQRVQNGLRNTYRVNQLVMSESLACFEPWGTV
jgi:hypothetical protein